MSWRTLGRRRPAEWLLQIHGEADGAQLVVDDGDGVLSGNWRQDGRKFIKVVEDGKVCSRGGGRSRLSIIQSVIHSLTH